jgi:predicted adenine nucleotide alpha hydrolase (AANH) superfamily ATPase
MSEAKPKILVHLCCAACASYVFAELEKNGFEIIGFFYNPEVHGLSEYKRRLKDIVELCSERNIKLIVPDYNVSDFFSLLLPFQDTSSIKYISDKSRYKRRRCQTCILMLINRLFEEGKKMKADFVTTSMLCSPFRNHEEIWNTAVDIANSKGLQFLYRDFRKGYWNGRNFARTHDYVIPKYCGCTESLEEGLLE